MSRIQDIKRLVNGGGLFALGTVGGTLYIPSISAERNIIEAVQNKMNTPTLISRFANRFNISINVGSMTKVEFISNNQLDYIFTDPPFGANIMYSELNSLWESWQKVFTNNRSEAIVNSTHGKGLLEYQRLMEACFKEYYRVLKPGRWMTVEFSNSQSTVWNAIQEAIQRAGFVIANVSVLDKKQGSFKAVTTTTAVKQDLVISAYKPKQEHIDKMKREQNTEESAWTFVKQHLEQLPVFIGEKGKAELIVERTPRALFDRMVAYHVQNGLPVPLSSAEFQEGVAQRFPMRDGMVFLESQVAEYDKKRILAKEFTQLSLFVSDENSAIEWLRQQLLKKPQTRQELHPDFMKEIQHIAKHEKLPELDELLEQNFLKYEGDGPVPSQIHSYLSSNYKDLRGLDKDDPRLKEKAKNRWYVPDPNKQADLEKLREKALLREFAAYKQQIESSKKKLKQFRTEAIRAGFKKAWAEKDYETIVKVGERLPEKVLQEDDKLLMYYDNAHTVLGL
ncbi:site-specific DNA-methyltransferase [Caldalkalibacillus thermarum TA2.A1]|uniref:Site-specific DNA-methyltransferase n=2 Tax=Caldalkalibacillus thermarum (strain TA2.A1) TaxID=986075 RepID=A0A8X8ICI1_CALTT|nr:site-specific DNA-methyltransferase [Caldalkalibacillus thermarum TA2.A1]